MSGDDDWDLFGKGAETGYPHTPGWKEPTTSRDAAEIIESSAETLRGEALRLLKAHPSGLTADECADLMERSVLAVRPRITELKVLELIERSGERRKNRSGINAAVWWIKAK